MKWLREPLVHFLALGAGLFVLFAWVGGSDEESSDEVVVSARQIEILAEGFARTWQRQPTGEELAGLIDDHVREELYYREALAMGLDRDDTIIRRRLRQKMEFFTDDLLAAVEPTDEELRGYLAENQEKFRIPPRVTFEHVYFNTDRREDAAADAEAVLTRLREGGGRVDVEALGDSLPLPRKYAHAPVDRLGDRFGGSLAERLENLPVGAWAGPIESGFGLHLVLISEREPGSVPPFEEVQEVVEREWRAEERSAAKETFYQTLRQRYSVVVEEPTLADAESGDAEAGGASR